MGFLFVPHAGERMSYLTGADIRCDDGGETAGNGAKAALPSGPIVPCLQGIATAAGLS